MPKQKKLNLSSSKPVKAKKTKDEEDKPPAHQRKGEVTIKSPKKHQAPPFSHQRKGEVKEGEPFRTKKETTDPDPSPVYAKQVTVSITKEIDQYLDNIGSIRQNTKPFSICVTYERLAVMELAAKVLTKIVQTYYTDERSVDGITGELRESQILFENLKSNLWQDDATPNPLQ